MWHWYVECDRCAVGTSSYLVLAIKRRNSLKCKESIQSKSAEPHQHTEQSLSVPCPQPPNPTLENSHPQAKARLQHRLQASYGTFSPWPQCLNRTVDCGSPSSTPENAQKMKTETPQMRRNCLSYVSSHLGSSAERV